MVVNEELGCRAANGFLFCGNLFHFRNKKIKVFRLIFQIV